MADLLRRWPRLARFVSEFGAQAVPESDEFIEPERWPELDWDRLAVIHGLQRDNLERYVGSEGLSFTQWRAASQRYQAALVQLQVEDLRRLKYRPTGGFAHFLLTDAHPAISWSVLDHERAPKAGYAALRDACREVLGMLDPRTGAVHVVSERRQPLADAVITVTVDGATRRFGGAVDADAVSYVGAVDRPRDDAEVVVSHPDLGTVVNTYDPDLVALVTRPGRGDDHRAADSGAKSGRP